MGVVATGTGKGPFRSAWIFDPLYWVTTNRVALDHIFKGGVTTHAQIINWFIKLKTVIGGMGTVTGNAAAALDDAVDVIGGAVFSKQVFFVRMAGHADYILASCPELGTILVGVGVVTDRAVAGTHRAVDMFHLQPSFFADMALETAGFHLAHRDGDFVGVSGLLMTGSALQGGGWAVFPVILNDVFMAFKTERLGLLVNGSGWLGRFCVVALLAGGGQQLVAVEERDPFFVKIDVEQGA